MPWLVLCALPACGGHAPPPAAPPPPPKVITLAVLPAESDAFPKAAEAATESLSQAHITGVDRTQVSKVSLEVVQLSIECVEPTPACYQAVGKTLAADRLLFAQIAPGPKKKQLKVTVSLFDVQVAAPPRTAEATFGSEKEATTKIGDLVAQVTR
jgi:hypothetical protein